jgi:hypothetical protein
VAAVFKSYGQKQKQVAPPPGGDKTFTDWWFCLIIEPRYKHFQKIKKKGDHFGRLN